jgi:enoyl-CoA hydratase/carnithine racemase
VNVTTYDVDEAGVALVRLDRPEARNAINTQMLEEILGHLAAARDDERVRVLVVSSTDHMALSAGADVREELEADGRVRRMELFARVYDELTAFPKPTVAACHGSCVGGGAEIAVACDLRVGGANLRMRFPGGALGVPVGPARLVTLCGLSMAKYLLLTARDVSAEEALRWGLVHRVAPAATTEAEALRLATGVAENPPEAVARLKRMLHEGTASRSARVPRARARWSGSARGPGFRTRASSGAPS